MNRDAYRASIDPLGTVRIARAEDGVIVARCSKAENARRIIAALNLTATMTTEDIEGMAAPSPEPFTIISVDAHARMTAALRAIVDRAPKKQPADSEFEKGDDDPDLYTEDAWYEASKIARAGLGDVVPGAVIDLMGALKKSLRTDKATP